IIRSEAESCPFLFIFYRPVKRWIDTGTADFGGSGFINKCGRSRGMMVVAEARSQCMLALPGIPSDPFYIQAIGKISYFFCTDAAGNGRMVAILRIITGYQVDFIYFQWFGLVSSSILCLELRIRMQHHHINTHEG